MSRKCPCLLFSKQRRNSWLKLTQILFWSDELLLWPIIYVPEEIKSEHLCAYPEVIQSCTQSLSEVENKHLQITSLPPNESASEETGTAQIHEENLRPAGCWKSMVCTWSCLILSYRMRIQYTNILFCFFLLVSWNNQFLFLFL